MAFKKVPRSPNKRPNGATLPELVTLSATATATATATAKSNNRYSNKIEEPQCRSNGFTVKIWQR